MTDDPNNFLNELTIWKLKAVAEEFGVDISDCRHKRDYVQKIASKNLTEEQVRNVLSKTRKKDVRAEGDVKAIGEEIESIARSPSQAKELPREEEKSVDRHLDEALMLKPALFEVDSKTQAAYNKMILGEYYDAIRLNRDARLKGLENFSSFQVYSAAMSIRAADELFAKLVSEKGELDPILKTALAEAKLAFIGGTPKRREEALENLEVLATKAYDAFVANTEKEEAELMGLLADYESFGTRTDESRRYLEIASQAKRAMNVAEYSKLLKSARDSADRARGARAVEIKSIFPIVRAATVVAKEVGVETSSAETRLEEAKKAYEDGALARSLEILTTIERQVDSAHLELIRTRRELESKQLETAKATLATHDPVLAEANSYGLDVGEGMFHANNVRAAVRTGDAVNAAKYSTRVKEIVQSMEKDIDAKRVDLGVIKQVEGTKCGKCGQETVYSYPDKSQKCLECGEKKTPETPAPSQTIPPQTAAAQETKKKGFLRW